MLYRISVTERGLTGIANIFRSRLSRLDDLLGAGTVPLIYFMQCSIQVIRISDSDFRLDIDPIPGYR